MRRLIKAGFVMAVVGALVFSGLALAQTEDAPAEADGERAVARLIEHLHPLVDEGTISIEQAEAVAEYLVENRPERPRRALVGLHLLRHTADVLDITGPQLREDLGDGGTIAQLAQANGSSGEALVEYLVEDVEDHLAQAVERGRIDEERAAELLTQAEDRITEFVFDTPQWGERRAEGA